MAKKKLNNPQEGLEFHDLYAQQPEEIRQMLDEFNINSFEDLMGFAVMIGIDPDKLIAVNEKNGAGKLPEMEEIMFDEDNPAGDFYRMLRDMEDTEDYVDDEYDDVDDEYDDDYDDDEMFPFALPDEIFFEDLPAQKYHLRIKLNNAPVPIWREIEVPSNISLEFLAFVAMETMGWENEHLHQFKKKNIIYKNRACLKYEPEMFDFLESQIRTVAADNYPISDIFKEKGDRIEFEYDFGDCWRHDIWLKGISEYQPDESKTLKLLKGKGMCPPEDCGGIYGYAYLLEILNKKRKSADDKDRLEWFGIEKGYDPNEFDFDQTKDNLYDLWTDAMDK